MGSQRRIDLLESKEEIIRSYSDGASARSLALRFKSGHSPMLKLLRQWGVTKNEGTKEKFLRLKEQISKDYEDRLGAKEIALKYGFNQNTLWGYLTKSKIRSGWHRDDLEHNRDEIIALYNNGWGTHRIAGKYDTSSSGLRRKLLQWGIKLRSQVDGCLSRYKDEDQRNRIGDFFRSKHQDKKFNAKLREAVRKRSADPQYITKLSESLKGKYMGSLASGWKGGISFSPYPVGFDRELKEKIRRRDGFQCMLCYVTEEESIKLWHRLLSVHHIDYNKNNINETNLITLCHICNVRVNKDREVWEQLFNSEWPTDEDFGNNYFIVKDGHLYIKMTAPHQQVLPFFPRYLPRIRHPSAITDYRDPNNAVGHMQRGLLTYYAIKSFIESNGGIGLDLGGAGVQHPACLSLDLCGNEPHPVYGGAYTGVHVKGDAADLSRFLDNSFSCVLSNHLVEHLPCMKLIGNETAEEKIKLSCSGKEIADILRYHWLRVLRPGGWFVHVVPDNEHAMDGGSHVFYQDPSHQHAWSAREFRQNVLDQIKDLVDVIEYDTFFNHFSFNLVLRKR